MDGREAASGVQTLVHVPVPGGRCVVIHEAHLSSREAVAVLTAKAGLSGCAISENSWWTQLLRRHFTVEFGASVFGPLSPRRPRGQRSPGVLDQGIALAVAQCPGLLTYSHVLRRLIAAGLAKDASPFAAIAEALRRGRASRAQAMAQERAWTAVTRRIAAAKARGHELSVAAAVTAWLGDRPLYGGKAEAAYKAFWREKERRDAATAQVGVAECKNHAECLDEVFVVHEATPPRKDAAFTSLPPLFPKLLKETTKTRQSRSKSQGGPKESPPRRPKRAPGG